MTSTRQPNRLLGGALRVACLMTALLATGCNYYQVVDTKTGQVYYSDKWIAADGYTGPLKFTDSTGKPVELRSSQVNRLSKQDYLDATTQQMNQPGMEQPTP